jgi:hypothetical protein
MADELTASDPRLASMLGVFSRLTLGEEMPVRQQAGERGERDPGQPYLTGWYARRRRRPKRRTARAWPPVAALLGLVKAR